MTQTAELLIEIRCEEIPARMQKSAVEGFKNLFQTKLEEHAIEPDEINCYITPRRIVIHVPNLLVTQADREEERKGPKVGSPEKAIEGFLASLGYTSVDQCEIEDSPKGQYYIARKQINGQSTDLLLPQILKEVLEAYTWPKSMRWARNGFSWVRPIQSIFCVFNGVHVTGRFDLGEDQIVFTNTLSGHRFLSQTSFTAHDFSTYCERMQNHFVIIDQEKRKQIILEQINSLAEQKGLSVRQDPDLLDEVNGLVEWPHALIGEINEQFMDLPDEVLITSMRVHQKYFALQRENTHLAPYFILVSNIVPKDDGKAVIEGNERVLRARLSDAKFFFEQDQKTDLLDHSKKLVQSIFHADLGTMAEKVERITKLSAYLAEITDVGSDNILKASALCKADLSTEMVKEFPELQGIMGYYYSLKENEGHEVAEAIADHYKPKSANDDLPRSKAGSLVALADKIDTIVGMFSVGIKPTGSKDPFALRRSALGSIRLLETLEGIHLDELVANSYRLYEKIFALQKDKVQTLGDTIEEVRLFFLERLKVYWRDQGMRHDYITAVFSVAKNEPLSVLARRVRSLNEFLTRVDGAGEQLLFAYRRASNIVRIEEKKDHVVFDPNVNPALLKDETEHILYKKLSESLNPIRITIEEQKYDAAMEYVTHLRPHIDAFFDKVTVNAEDPSIRANRLRLLSLIRDTLHQVADFSKIEG